MAIYILLDRVPTLLLCHSMVGSCRALNHLAQHDAGLDLNVIIADGCQPLILPNSDVVGDAPHLRLCR